MSALPQAMLTARVLIVEDCTDFSEGLVIVLRTAGHTVAVAHDAPTGLATAAVFQPDLIISDIGLPRMDGFALARALRNDSSLRKCYLVALTGYASAQDREQALAAGFDEHVAKPVDVEGILRLVDRISSQISRQPGNGARPANGPRAPQAPRPQELEAGPE